MMAILISQICNVLVAKFIGYETDMVRSKIPRI